MTSAVIVFRIISCRRDAAGYQTDLSLSYNNSAVSQALAAYNYNNGSPTGDYVSAYNSYNAAGTYFTAAINSGG
jgi:hypothetical protein